jgi:hypothetical protein
MAALGAVVLMAAAASANAAPGARPGGKDHAAAPTPGSGLNYVFVNGEQVGTATAHQGGTLVGTVAAESNGNFESKALSGTTLETCELTLTFAMSRSLRSWIRSQVNGRNEARTVSIIRANNNRVPVAALTLTDAQLIGLTVSGVDAARGESPSLTLQLAASGSTRSTGTEFPSIVNLSSPGLSRRSYDVKVAGVVRAVNSMSSVRMARLFNGERFGPWVVDDLTFRTTRPAGGTWEEWYRDVVVNARDDERSVLVQFLRSNLTVGATITLGGVGLFAADDNLDNPPDVAPQRTFRAYVESVDLLIADPPAP